MIDKFTHSPVFPIVPCYYDNENLHPAYTLRYLEYLQENGAKIFMTTAGTSQFNLLSNNSVAELNTMLFQNMCLMDHTCIFGLKPGSINQMIAEIDIHEKIIQKRGNQFFLLKYPERYYNDSTIISYFDEVASYSHLPCLIHCSPFMNGITGKPYDYTAELINSICEHDNIVGIKEETGDLLEAYHIVSDLNDDIGVVCAGGSQRRLNYLHFAHKKKNITFLAGVGSLFPKLDIDQIYRAEHDLFSVFFKHGWHPSLRYALQYLKLIPEYDRQPWPELRNVARKEIENVVDEIKELI